MTKHARDVPELVRAAEELEEQVRNLEALSLSIRKIRLDSGKNIARAGKELNRALTLPQGLGKTLLGLAEAMQAMQARQQAALDPLSAFASEIQNRMTQLERHMQALATLGTSAAEVTHLIQSTDEPAIVLEQVNTKLGALADVARELFQAAQRDEFPEIARDAQALQQRLTALRNRLAGAQSN